MSWTIENVGKRSARLVKHHLIPVIMEITASIVGRRSITQIEMTLNLSIRLLHQRRTSLKRTLKISTYLLRRYEKLKENNSELSFLSDEEIDRKLETDKLIMKPFTKKEMSTSPHSKTTKYNFDEIQPKKKSSRSLNNKDRRKQDKTHSRKQIWFEISGAKSLMDSNPGYYQSLKANFLQYPNP